MKNALRSKEETDNTPTDKTEQVTLGIKQSLSFQILSFFKEIQTINTILLVFNMSWQIAVAPTPGEGWITVYVHCILCLSDKVQ